MEAKHLSDLLTVSAQISAADLPLLQAEGVSHLICNRPDGEGEDQPDTKELTQQAAAAGMQLHYLPVVLDTINSADVMAFGKLTNNNDRIHAFCRSGARSTTLWALSQIAKGRNAEEVIQQASNAGKNLENLTEKFASVLRELSGELEALPAAQHCPILIVGGGSAGISLASSLLKRQKDLDITIIEPSSKHYYQPGFTLIGGGVMNPSQTMRSTDDVMPDNVKWIKAAVTHFLPETNQLVLDNDTRISYDRLCICPGLKLNWSAIPGLETTLGKNGVTSNYLPGLAPYTWELVQQLGKGRAVFTQPPMPIKCAGAPQKALYLSADYWLKKGCLKDITVDFYNAGAVIFGVADYVPALEHYIKRYSANCHFNQQLVAVDGPQQTATFAHTDSAGTVHKTEVKFDMLHVCPPQCAPDFIRNSAVADRAGWVDVSQATLQHKRYGNIWGLGDATNTPNAKTAAAVRKQAPIVANNMLTDLLKHGYISEYDGYGACPLTVERGKVVLAEFSYGGKVSPSLPTWILKGTRPTRMGWWLKKTFMPLLYWHYMLKGREPLVRPEPPK